MKKLIDANVILRYLLRDHPQMSETAKEIIEAGAYTIPEVLAEVVYVLKGVYEVGRIEIAQTLIEFVDCILIARHKVMGEEIASFDRKLNKML